LPGLISGYHKNGENDEEQKQHQINNYFLDHYHSSDFQFDSEFKHLIIATWCHFFQCDFGHFFIFFPTFFRVNPLILAGAILLASVCKNIFSGDHPCPKCIGQGKESVGR
jgi:hypothetical protein